MVFAQLLMYALIITAGFSFLAFIATIAVLINSERMRPYIEARGTPKVTVVIDQARRIPTKRAPIYGARRNQARRIPSNFCKKPGATERRNP